MRPLRSAHRTRPQARRRARTRVRAALAGACALALLSGCASIPDSGGIGRIDVGDAGPNVQSRIDPDGPAEDADPDEIVRGFLTAGAGYSNNFAVARSFLTDDFSDRWNPQAQVAVLPSGVSLDSVTSEITSNSQRIALSVPVGATLDESRIYREAGDNTNSSMKFSLRQVNGQWRISKAPDGLLLSATNFATLFQSYALYYYTPDYKNLVPDVRWFIRSPSTATEVIAELLRGPSDYLSGAVVSAAPDGTQLDPKSVTVSEGRAEVGLARPEGSLDDRTAGRLVDQLEASLTQISSITSVSVTSAGAELDSKGGGADSSVQIDSRPIVVSDRRIATVEGSAFTPVERSPRLPVGARDPAVAIDGSVYAYLTKDGKEIRHFSAGEGRDHQIVRGAQLVGPSFDRYGWMWTAEASGKSLIAVSSGGDSTRLAAKFLGDRTIRSLHVSRDGSRVGVLSADSSGRQRLDIVGIARSGRSEPARLAASPLTLGQEFTSLTEFSWAGADTVAVLGNTGDGGVQPFSMQVSGPASALGTISDAARIAAAEDLRSVRVGTAGGSLYTYSGGSWQKIVDAKAYDPAYAG